MYSRRQNFLLSLKQSFITAAVQLELGMELQALKEKK
jgi:hypothetical protein